MSLFFRCYQNLGVFVKSEVIGGSPVFSFYGDIEGERVADCLIKAEIDRADDPERVIQVLFSGVLDQDDVEDFVKHVLVNFHFEGVGEF